MVEQKSLAVTLRTTMGKANKQLRRVGLIPGNISGHSQEPQPVQVDAVAFDTLCRNHAATGLIQLTLSDASVQAVLIRHVQHAPSTGKVIHIDFSRVGTDERVTAKVSLRYVGESAAVKDKGGVLIHLMETLDIECPASAIVDNLQIDISPLTEIDAILHAGDVKLPASYTLITPQEEPIAKVVATRAAITSESEATASAAAESDRPETKGEGKA